MSGLRYVSSSLGRLAGRTFHSYTTHRLCPSPFAPFLALTEPSSPLDSSLKKHTTLLNRLRSALLTTSSETLIKEIDGLALTKYVEEIVAAVGEGVVSAKGAKADVESAVEVSML